MKFEVVTLFPRLIDAALQYGVLSRAVERGVVSVGTEDPRAWATDAHRTVDDRPYGGGPGMVLKPGPVLAAVRAAQARLPAGSLRVCLTAQGERLTQQRLFELARLPGMLLIAGRYEGLDERIIRLGSDCELSVGDYVLSGGELPALVVIDAVTRLLPGALGDERSSVEESFAQGLLEAPQYTRPEVFEGLPVPAPLLSGNHAEIRRWRLRQSVIRTWHRRPDLVAGLTGEARRELDDYLAAHERGDSDEGEGHEQDRSGD